MGSRVPYTVMVKKIVESKVVIYSTTATEAAVEAIQMPGIIEVTGVYATPPEELGN